MTTVLALDLATTAGFAFGTPGMAEPHHGSVRFATEGAKPEAIFAAALTWATNQFREWKPSLIVWEAPMPTSFNRGRTTVDVTTILYGLPAIVGAVAYLLGIYDVRKAKASDVRHHFIGENPKRVIAKRKTVARCREMGFSPDSDDAADAIATWFYMCAIVAPETALRATPLFGDRNA